MKKLLNKVKWSEFLKDVFICSIGAYGGPEAHFGVITDQMVIKKKYLSEEELVELIALTGILPGPSSTQSIVAIGYKVGGPLLALYTMLVWALPVVLIMTLLSFTFQFFENMNISQDGLKYIGPMAVGFIFVAAFRLSKKILVNNLSIILWFLAIIITYLIRTPWIYPLVLISGGFVTILFSKEKDLWNKVNVNPPWLYFGLFIFFALGSTILHLNFNNRLIYLFEMFYRYGYLVIGGGQVVVPMMFNELVEVNNFMTSQQFLTGFGLVQGMPGPMFSFSAYAGGMASRDLGMLIQVMGALISAVGIFLPGLLLIYFIYPIWEEIKKIKGIKLSIKGISAVAAGVILTSGIVLLQKNGLSIDNIVILLITVVLLLSKKIPAPIIVLLVLILGVIF